MLDQMALVEHRSSISSAENPAVSTTSLVAIWINYGNMWQVLARETREKFHSMGAFTI
jgi:hypothetical protein